MADAVQVAETIVESLHRAGVKYVFGVPGAKIDALFDILLNHPEIKLIVARHEQNAAFMAAAIGRITGVPGVCIATSGPGAGNLTTGLVTATTEGDAVVALVGSVSRVASTKHTHQSMKTLDILAPATKLAVSIEVEDQAAEVILSAFRTALTIPRGATVVSIPMDVAAGKSTITAFPSFAFQAPSYGPAPHSEIEKVASMINKAKLPVLFLGQRASAPPVISAIRQFLMKHRIAVVETFQAAGAVPQDLAENVFFGRVGIFHNQVGDRLLAASDLVLALGYDPTEYDAQMWNPKGDVNIVHIDSTLCDYGVCYAPKVELLGAVRENILALADAVSTVVDPASHDLCKSLRSELTAWHESIGTNKTTSGLVQPLHFVSCLQERVPKDMTVTVDVGTVYIYMMRYFLAYEPRHLLCSNGQQTLGVGMPWAISASLVQDPPCSRKVVSISGDGGFMFSSQELSTAVQQGCNITHFVWNSASYNMVEFQEEMKYGRSSGINLGGVDFAKFAEAFGAKGFRIDDASQVESVMDAALSHQGVALVDVKIDYTHAIDLAGDLIKDSVA